MANYNVDIAVALKGAKKLTAFSKDVRTTQLQVEGLNKSLKNAAKDQNLLVRSFQNLNTVLSSAKANFNAVASGTSKQITAAKQLISAEKQLNKELLLRNRLLSGGQSAQSKRLPIDPVLKSIQRNSRKRTPIQQTKSEKTASSFLGFSQSADKILAEKIVSTKRQELELQEALLALEQRSAAKQNEKLQIQGELNRQTALAVNNAKLRGQFSPLTSDIRGNIGDIKSRRESNILSSRRNQFGNVFTGRSGRDFGQIGGRIGPVEPIRSAGGFLSFSKRADEIATRSPLPPRSSLEPGKSLFGQSVSIEGRSEKIIRERFALSRKLAEMTERDLKAKNKSVNIEERLKKGIQERNQLSAALEKMEKRSAANLKDQVKLRKQSRKIGQDNVKLKIKEAQATRKVAQNEALASRTAARRRIGSTASSAIIGGAFPLLFGQTGAAAVGGGLGGLAGGAIGGQFGFALSILGTAIGSAIDKSDKFNLSVAKLNGQLKTLGFDSQFTGNEINKLAKFLKITKEEALQVAGAFSRFGKERGQLLAQTIGQDTGGLFAIANVKNQATALQAIEAISKNITFEKQAELIASLKNNTATQIQLKLQEILLEAKFEEQKSLIEEIGLRERIFSIVAKTVLKLSEGSPDMVESPEDRVARELKELKERFDKLKLIFDGVIGSIQSIQTETDNLQFSITGAVENIEKDLKKLQDPMFQLIEISGAIGNSFGESFKGIVKGTMTAQDALRNLFQRTADAFLDMAAQMIAKQIQLKILGIGLNFIGGGSKQVTDTVFTPSVNSAIDNPFELPKLAGGGMAKAGRTHLVGERGPELFTPGVSGMITPNHALGGSTSIVVNVDASGSSVEGDSDGQQFG